MKELGSIFSIYKPQGLSKALWVVLRILILPYRKLDAIVPLTGTIVDIGCGNGGLTNYLALRSPKRNVKGIDLSREKISVAFKSVGKRKNIQFIFGDAVTTKLPKVDCYLMVDVLHHLPFQNQEKLLRYLSQQLNKNSRLIIKEVDKSNPIPFLFGHTIEKILYPKDTIYARSQKDWEALFETLGLSFIVTPGVFYFPDSTKIFIVSLKI